MRNSPSPEIAPTSEPLVRVQDLTGRGSPSDRLWLAPELCRAADAPPDGYAAFLPDAVAPYGAWRSPTPEEASDLLGKPRALGRSDLFIAAVPRVVGELSRYLGSREDFTHVSAAVRDLKFVEALDACVEELLPYCQSPTGLVCQGVCVSSGGMRMVTHNRSLDPPRRIGLHVDDWDGLPLSERAGGRRRLCVNLGLEPRYFIFLRRPVSALVAADQFPRNCPEHLSPAILVRAHLARNLRQPAVRVRIDPGEAYIVNADDVIHDGSASDGSAPDIALHFLGHFGPSDFDDSSQE